MAMRPSGAHGSGQASDPGPVPNRSGCVRMRPTRYGAGPGCSYKATGTLQCLPTHQLDLKRSCHASLRPESLPSFCAVRAAGDCKGAGWVVKNDDFPPSKASWRAAAGLEARARSKLGEKEGKLRIRMVLMSTSRRPR